MDRSDGPCTAWHTSPVKTWQDMLDKEFIVGSSGVGSQMDVYPAAMNKLFGTKMRVIGGYKDGALIFQAMEREEVHGRCGPQLTSIGALRPHWLTEKKIRVPIVVSEQRSPLFPDAPTLIELAKDEPTRQQIRLLIVSQDLDRPVLAPPGLPAERVKLLRDAFNATMKDPAFLADIKKLRLTLDWVSGEDVQKMLATAYSAAAGRGRRRQGTDGRQITRRQHEGANDEGEGMFAKINHVAIVSEKYALITKFYEAAFGMYQSKTSPKSALTVGDGYVGLNINPRKAGRPGRPRPFRHPGRGRRDRLRPHAHEISGRRLGAAAVDAAVRRHHRQRSRRQRVRHLAEGHEEPRTPPMCRTQASSSRAASRMWRCAPCAPTRWRASISTCSSSPSRTRAPAIPTIISPTARSR